MWFLPTVLDMESRNSNLITKHTCSPVCSGTPLIWAGSLSLPVPQRAALTLWPSLCS